MRFIVCPMVGMRNAKPILPWIPPSAECMNEPTQWMKAATALMMVRSVKMASDRVTGDTCLRSFWNHAFQPKCKYRCQTTLPGNIHPIMICIHIHDEWRLPIASSSMLEASVNAVIHSSMRSRNQSLSAFVIDDGFLSIRTLWQYPGSVEILLPLKNCIRTATNKKKVGQTNLLPFILSGWGDSNARPLRPERSALPTALHSDCSRLISGAMKKHLLSILS